MQTFLNVVLIILVIALIALAVLYYFGRKMEKRQAEQQSMMEAAKQTVFDQTPWYMRRAKLPIVKAKVGPKVLTLIADDKAFLQLPVKTEAKVVISGLYITDVKSVRGGIPPLPKKKGFFARFKKDKSGKK